MEVQDTRVNALVDVQGMFWSEVACACMCSGVGARSAARACARGAPAVRSGCCSVCLLVQKKVRTDRFVFVCFA